MDVVEKLLKERTRLYETIKYNCVPPVIETGHCDLCHEIKHDTDTYNQETLNKVPEPPRPDQEYPISPQHPIKHEEPPKQEVVEDNVQQQNLTQEETVINNNVPLFL